ncbi:hypothetical protein BHM03_00053524, partial [Ensete ventricosum]
DPSVDPEKEEPEVRFRADPVEAHYRAGLASPKLLRLFPTDADELAHTGRTKPC